MFIIHFWSFWCMVCGYLVKLSTRQSLFKASACQCFVPFCVPPDLVVDTVTYLQSRQMSLQQIQSIDERPLRNNYNLNKYRYRQDDFKNILYVYQILHFFFQKLKYEHYITSELLQFEHSRSTVLLFAVYRSTGQRNFFLASRIQETEY